MHTPLVSEIDILVDRKALSVLVRQDDGARRLRLADHVFGARLVEEAVVDAGAIPGIHAVGAPERGIADEGVTAAVIGVSVGVGTVVILL